MEALVTLGIDVSDEPDEPGATYTPVIGADPDSYPA